jgi:hypothetical protein
MQCELTLNFLMLDFDSNGEEKKYGAGTKHGV